MKPIYSKYKYCPYCSSVFYTIYRRTKLKIFFKCLWCFKRFWNTIEPAKEPTTAPDREHPAVSEGKSAEEIQKGYRDYLRAHRGR